VVLEPTAEAPLAALVFKTISEQHVGDLSLLRLYSGRLVAGSEVYNATRGANERVGQFFRLNGHQREEINTAEAGDIVALVKLRNTHTNDTLTVRNSHIKLPATEFPVPLIAVAKDEHHPGWRERHSEPVPLPANATPMQARSHHLKTKAGRAAYALRKQTVEPVFGIIKSVMGFRQFLLRGLEKVTGEWSLVCLAWNIKRMAVLRRNWAGSPKMG
jgi:hypothetical protein